LEKALGQSFVLQEAKSVKFLGIVNPNENAVLNLQCDVVALENGDIKTNSVITAGDKVCYKASAVYAGL
jgi:3-hydroxymyristoyl/3-hydroxydecanoyl-(acyl carrier protein) dehydratase